MRHIPVLLLLMAGPAAIAGEGELWGPREGELCDICIDLVSTLKEWITADTTMDEIIAFVEQFCAQLGILQNTCELFVESRLPDLLEQMADHDPWTVCNTVLGGCPTRTTTPEPITTPPDDWYYLETFLDGGKVLSLIVGDVHCNMRTPRGHEDQLWRLKADGCLMNKHQPSRCLEMEGNSKGSGVGLHEANGLEVQKWTYTDNTFENNVRSDLYDWHLVIDIVWSDVPMHTSGATVEVHYRDSTASQKWRMVKYSG